MNEDDKKVYGHYIVKGDKEIPEGIKVLFSSDSPDAITGFAVQLRGVAEFFGKELGIETHYLGWQTSARPMYYKERGFTLQTAGKENYSFDRYSELFSKIKPDLLITLGDEHMINGILGESERPLWIGYFPVDGHPLNGPMKRTFSKIDIKIAMALYGKKVCDNAGIKDAIYIPHFFKEENFYPKDKNEAREKMGLPKDKFIIGSVARLNPRKHQMRLVAAFSLFAKDKDDVALYMNFDTKDSFFFKDKPVHDYMWEELVETISDMVDSKNIDKIIYQSSFDFRIGLEEDEMVDLYNSFDIHAIATGGEGFGVPTIEAMACGIPSVLTDYTTSDELLISKSIEELVEKDIQPVSFEKQRGILVPYKKLYLEKTGVHKAWIDIKFMADAFEKYYQSWKNNDDDLLETHKQNCIDFAPSFEYKHVMETYWRPLMDYLIPNIKIIEE